MPSYPTPSDYQEAVQFPETAFEDEQLQQALPRENMLGLPQPITGAFAAVFPMTVPTGEKWAVKCFLTDVPDQHERYRAISAHLSDHPLACMAGFDYQQPGIRVEGDSYPVLKMEWVDGVPLNRFVAEHHHEPDVLSHLADAWAAVLDDLAGAEIAHGDLQHGNVLVQGGGEGEALRIRLVDYDTMYVPALSGRTSAEVGHRNYQHPDRTDEDFGPYLDHFAGLAVYVALRACAERPDLWDRFDTGENILFRDADFYDPSASVLFDELASLASIQGSLEALRTACFVAPADVPSLSDVLGGQAEQRLSEAPRTSRSTAQDARAEHSQRRRRSAFAQWFLPVGAGVVLVAAACAGLLSPTAGLGVVGLGVAAGVWGGVRQYRRLPIVRRRQRLRQEIERFTRLIETQKRQIESLKRKRRSVLDTVDERRAERLEEVQEEALYDQLKHHFIGEAGGVEGITHKVVVRLKAAGIRTAYEATPERLASIRRLGDDSRARLNMWRAALVTEYADAIPQELSPAEERRLQRYVERRIDDIDTQIARARQKIQVHDEERERLEGRVRAIPLLTPVRYIAYLVRLRALPRMEGRPAPPQPVVPREDARQTVRAPSSAPPDSAMDDEAWWTRRSA